MGHDWNRKRTVDAYLASVPSGLRQQMREQFENQQKETTVMGAIAGLPRPFLQKKEKGTEEVPHTSEASSMATYPSNDMAKFSAKTSVGDGHVHTAYVDGHGNGYTDVVDNHRHDVVSFHVADTQTADGLSWHSHPGKITVDDLPTYDPTPDYTGEV